jgi:hypothetical protein
LDYQGEELRGKSFRGMDLDGANFSEADLRGADFTGASLVGADFTNARLGVHPLTGLVILASTLAIAIAAGVVTGFFAQAARDRVTSSEWQDLLTGWTLLSVVVLFFVVIVLRGVQQALIVFLVVAVAAVILETSVVLIYGDYDLETGLPLIGLLLLFGPAAVAGILGRIVGGTFGVWATIIVAVAGGIAAGRFDGGLAAIAVSVLLAYVSKRALEAHDRERPIHRVAQRIMTRRGTRFADADVTDANFTGTLLTQSDMTHAVLSGAIWEPGSEPITFDEANGNLQDPA